MTRFLAFFTLLVLPFLGTSIAQADPKSCAVLFREDQALRAALPERVRSLLESNRGNLLFTNREAAWEPVIRGLDEGAAKPGKAFTLTVGSLVAKLEFARAPAGELSLRIHSLADANGGEASGLDFLEFIAAQVAWVTKKRAAGGLTAIEVSGRDLRSASARELLESLGFERRRGAVVSCLGWTAVGGVAGFGTGYLVFTFDEAKVEGGAPEDQRREFLKKTLGGTAGFALGTGALCVDRARRDYRLRIEPEVSPAKEPPLPEPPAEAPTTPASAEATRS
jgi:hypothetical protein